ncbi:MAG: hypothetical protein U1F34_09190 [Gammaproteobacteria bacterium]
MRNNICRTSAHSPGKVWCTVYLLLLLLGLTPAARAVHYQLVYVPVTISINGKPVVIRRPVVRPVATPPGDTQPPAEANMPAWRKGIAVGQWREIPGTAMSSAPIAVQTHPELSYTGPKSKVIAWNGFAADFRESSIYSAASGGHMDYAGNEVDRLRLSDDAPTWTEPRSSTAVKDITFNTSYYADGRPTSRHSYYGAWVNELRNRVMLFAGAGWGLGHSPNALDGFNIAANDWDAGGTYALPGDQYEPLIGSAIVDQRSTGDVYVFSNWVVNRWNNATNTWQRMIEYTPEVYGQYAAAALDNKRNRILLLGGNGGDHAYYDLATNKIVEVPLTGSSAGILLAGDGNGMVYDPLLDAYLLHTGDAGGTVYRINPQTFAVDILPTIGGTSQPATTNNVWRRFLYLPKLKGIVYVPTYFGNVWFLRTY